ncbi:MAG: hypothetical protein HWQ40_35415 [Nostoc sp. NMS9]|nr:hypothetical protein [Nostoc sp. NMS9]
MGEGLGDEGNSRRFLLPNFFLKLTPMMVYRAPTAIHKGLDARWQQSIEVILLKNGKTMVTP